METSTITTISEVVTIITSLLTSFGVIIAVLQFIGTIRYNLKIEYTVGLLANMNPTCIDSTSEEESMYSSEYALIMTIINHSLFDVQIDKILVKFDKDFGIGPNMFQTDPLSSSIIKARSTQACALSLTDGILQLLRNQCNDSSKKITIEVQTPLKTFRKKTNYNLEKLSIEYQRYLDKKTNK